MSSTTNKIFLGSGMLIFGSINTISTKFADLQNVTGRPEFPPHPYSHPYVQGVGMFLGEFSCLLVFYGLKMYYKYKSRNSREEYVRIEDGDEDLLSTSNTQQTSPFLQNSTVNPFIFLIPALCDMIATSTVYFGLTFTHASSFQMLRGSVILFTSIFSILFLNRRIYLHMWCGIFFVVLGLVTVGLSDVLFGEDGGDKENYNILLGDMMIAAAQVVTGLQMCVEEKIVSGAIHPLQTVGWEGFWGTIILGSLLYPLSNLKVGATIAPNTPFHTLEDVYDAFLQLSNSRWIVFATLLNMSSIACFNFFGISVTKSISATTRMVLDSMRTIVIWSFSLAVGWQQFIPLQLLGFAFLITGMFWYNKVYIPSCIQPSYQVEIEDDTESERLLVNVDDENEQQLLDDVYGDESDTSDDGRSE